MTTTMRPLKRETFSSVRAIRDNRPLVIELHPTFVKVRPKGMQRFYTVTYQQIYTIGAKNAAEQARKERTEKRKGKLK